MQSKWRLTTNAIMNIFDNFANNFLYEFNKVGYIFPSGWKMKPKIYTSFYWSLGKVLWIYTSLQRIVPVCPPVKSLLFLGHCFVASSVFSHCISHYLFCHTQVKFSVCSTLFLVLLHHPFSCRGNLQSCHQGTIECWVVLIPQLRRAIVEQLHLVYQKLVWLLEKCFFRNQMEV